MAKGVYMGVSSTARKIKNAYTGVSGVARKVKKIYVGVARLAWSAGSTGLPVSNLPVGTLVKFNVNGVMKQFTVVHHGKPSSIYDDSFNNGVVLLIKDLYESREWHSSNVNSYADSTIHTYLNGTFLNLVAANIRSQIKSVKILYRPGSGASSSISSGTSGLSAKIFLLSGIEVGGDPSATGHTYDGAKMDYFPFGNSNTATVNKMRIGYLSRTATAWWLRSPYASGSTSAWSVGTGGYPGNSAICSNARGIRPALVLPNSITVSPQPDIDGAYIVS